VIRWRNHCWHVRTWRPVDHQRVLLPQLSLFELNIHRTLLTFQHSSNNSVQLSVLKAVRPLMRMHPAPGTVALSQPPSAAVSSYGSQGMSFMDCEFKPVSCRWSRLSDMFVGCFGIVYNDFPRQSNREVNLFVVSRLKNEGRSVWSLCQHVGWSKNLTVSAFLGIILKTTYEPTFFWTELPISINRSSIST
jgi:hypothetical protein